MRQRGRRIAASVVVLVLAVAAAFAIGRLSAPVVATPAEGSVEVGFARDMQVHHQQAVEMALIVRDLTDDEATRRLAYDIATSQENQAGQMAGWIETWGLPQAPSEPAMTWMTRPPLSGAQHGHGSDASAHTAGDPMPGYATPAQIAELKTLTGQAAERRFLELMIAHHRGGVEMAEAILDRSVEPVVTTLARGIAASQESEIELMQSMLDALP